MKTKLKSASLSLSEEIIFFFSKPQWPLGINRRTKKSLTTSNQTFLDQVILNDRDGFETAIIWNPHLQLRHFRYLLALPYVQSREIHRGAIVHNPAIPSDILSELALTEDNPFVLGIIADHPNTPEEDKVIAILSGAISADDYLEVHPNLTQRAERRKIELFKIQTDRYQGVAGYFARIHDRYYRGKETPRWLDWPGNP